MKRTTWISVWLLWSVLWAGAAAAAGEAAEDKTLSPYFLVQSEDSDLDRLPLKATEVAARIAGVMADVRVRQVYRNEGRRTLEAVYVFPASTRAAVYGMRMKIGERTIVAKIEERAKARKAYEQAKQEGKSASLLEQHRPNVFQMNVANILPGDVIEVELRYTELLVPTDAQYSFTYPTVVGPRYAGEDAGGSEWVANPYLHQGELPTATYDMEITLQAGLPIQEIGSPSHKVIVDYADAASARVRLDPTERHGANRDFILNYRLAGSRVETGLLLWEGQEENFFLLMVQPPSRVSAAEIPPREYVFIVDVSGSMHGFPLDVSKRLLRDLIGGLRPVDRFNVLLFAAGSQVMAPQSVPADDAHMRRALDLIERQRGGGGTRLLEALRRAFALPAAEGFSRTFVIATDGYVSVDTQTFDLIRNHLNQANVFAFGIGSSVNRHLIEGMARVGMGEPFVVTDPGQAAAQARRFRDMIATPVLTDIRVDFDGFETYDVEPASVPDVLAERPVIVFGKWRGQARGSIRLQGRNGGGIHEKLIDVGRWQPSPANRALRYLWARHRIALLSDYNRLAPDETRVEAVTRLGLTYNLLTAYTSFVAVDSLKRAQGEKATTVRQPLPLPQGVSDYAVGGNLAAVRILVAPMRPAPQKELAEQKALPGLPEPAKHKKPLLALEHIRVPEGLSAQVVKEALHQKEAALRACLAAGSIARIRLIVVLDAAGRVSAVRAPKAIPEALRFCLGRVLEKIRFSGWQGSAGQEIRFTLHLK